MAYNDQDNDAVSYKEAALMIGCTHHYVRMLTSRGALEISHREEVRPNVLKVFLTRRSIEFYKETRRKRYTKKIRVTKEEWLAVQDVLGDVA